MTGDGLSGIAENVSVVPKTKSAEEAGLGRSERVVTVRDNGPLKDTLLKNGFDDQTYDMVSATLKNVLNSANMPKGARLRILMGPSRTSETLIPHRLSIYFPDSAGRSGTPRRRRSPTAATMCWASPRRRSRSPTRTPRRSTSTTCPSVYRSIWETARKHDIDDAVTSRIVAMFAYDVDLTKKISAGDSIEILETEKDADGHQELLYVALHLGIDQARTVPLPHR